MTSVEDMPVLDLWVQRELRFRPLRLVVAACVVGSWPSLSRAIDAAQVEAREHGHDWPHCVFGEAAEAFEQDEPEYGALRWMSMTVWLQCEARH